MAFLFDDKIQPPLNFSPYTEWRASMMGLAGRDPIFHAQLESEKALRPSQTGFLDNTCYRCHGVMGQRQVELDKHEPFRHSMVYAACRTTPEAISVKAMRSTGLWLAMEFPVTYVIELRKKI